MRVQKPSPWLAYGLVIVDVTVRTCSRKIKLMFLELLCCIAITYDSDEFLSF